jgi:hypothetical protein
LTINFNCMKELLLAFVLLVALATSSAPGDGIEGCTGHENPHELITQ